MGIVDSLSFINQLNTLTNNIVTNLGIILDVRITCNSKVCHVQVFSVLQNGHGVWCWVQFSIKVRRIVIHVLYLYRQGNAVIIAWRPLVIGSHFQLQWTMTLRLVYIATKAIAKATSLPDGFVENPILCSHWSATNIKENNLLSHSLLLSVKPCSHVTFFKKRPVFL